MSVLDAGESRRIHLAAVCVAGGPVEPWLPTLMLLSKVASSVSLLVNGSATELNLPAIDRVTVESGNLEPVLDNLAEVEMLTAILVLSEPCLFDPRAFDRALTAMTDDMRIAVVCPIGNSSGYLSVPHRNSHFHHQIDDHDEFSIHRRLNDAEPSMPMRPIPLATGPAALLARHALGVVSSGSGEFGSGRAWLCDYSARCLQRGLLTYVDPTAFVLRPWDLGQPEPDPLWDDRLRHLLQLRHGWWPQVIDHAAQSPGSTVALAVQGARARIRGLRLAIDGRCLGPKEMGTQVQTLALVEALAKRDDVAEITIALPEAMPRYAAMPLSHIKIRPVVDPAAQFDGRSFDVVHRPFQPDASLPFSRWREVAHRTVLTVQDLIAYQVGPYHPSADAWGGYRSAMRRSISEADGLVVISHDTKHIVRDEGMSIDDQRVFVVENGSDHLRGDEPAVMPAAIADAGWAAAPFLLTLGVNYGHKNRDLAVRAWQELRKSGYPHRLVLVGAAVPIGSSRAAEARAMIEGGIDPDEVLVLTDVTSEERNWLLRHADLVLYPTSAEGFGLVPFEAARFGTSSVSVEFGPLREVAADLPGRARSWSPSDLASAAVGLLSDPADAAAQRAAILKAGTRYTWDRTAEGLVRSYLTLLDSPGRRD